jgi:hypothetical protein
MAESSQEKAGLTCSDAKASPLATSEPPLTHETTDPEKDSARDVVESAAEESGTDTDSSGGLERWNNPRINTYRYLVVNLSLGIMGMQDASLGVSCVHDKSCFNESDC